MKELSFQNWIEIDLDILADNARAIGKLLAPDCRLLAVVKADGYGHGALPVARTFLANGADYLGVATLTEAMELREGGIGDNVPILVFTPVESDDADLFAKHHLTATVDSIAAAQALSAEAVRAGKTVQAHAKLDTGMSRFGITPEEAQSFVRGVYGLPGIKWEGIYSHFANGYGGKDRMCQLQFNRFMSTVLDLAAEGFEFPIKHIANSPAVFRSREYHLDMVRVGNALYGLRKLGSPESEVHLQDSWSFKARVLQIKDVPAGTPVGYGGQYVANRLIRVATVGVGISDGFGLEVSARHYRLRKMLRSLVRVILERCGLARRLGLTPTSGWVSIDGQIAPVLGKVGTQHCMVDVTNVHGVETGHSVQLVAGRTGVNARVPRIYYSQGKPVLVRVLGDYREVSGQEGLRLRLDGQATGQVAASVDR